MASWRLGALCAGTLLMSGVMGAQRRERVQSCVTIVGARDLRGVAGARVSLAGIASGPVTTTDAKGRACLAERDSVGLQIDAVGYLPIDFVLGTRTAVQVALQPLPQGVMRAEWGSRQLVAALAHTLGRPETTRDSTARSVLNLALARMQSAPPQTSVSRDSVGVFLIAYLDLAPDGSRFSELRMRYSLNTSIVFGITTTHCGDLCDREHDIAISLVERDGAGWTPDFMVRKDTSGAVIRVAFDAEIGAPVLRSTTAEPNGDSGPSSTNVSGVIRSDRGALLAGIEVYTADGAVSTMTNSRGEYRLAVPMPPGGALITTRRLGWEPEFHKVSREDREPVHWSPTLKSTTVLATRFVRAAGIHDALQSRRYDGFLARRARGVGQFFMAEEIWSAVSLGDMLNRARGIRAIFTFGSRMSEIRVPSCSKFAEAVGVFVDGIDQTGMYDASGGDDSEAVNVLTRYVNAAIVGMEMYIGRTQMPGEFADPRYCAVIALWTR